MRKLTLLLILTSILISCNSSTSDEQQTQEKETHTQKELEETKQWIDFEYDSVVAYLYNVDSASYKYSENIVFGDSLSNTIISEYSTTLSSSEIAKVSQVMSTTPEKEYFADCFDPHHGIVFYKQGKIMGHISICFLCDNMHAKPETFVTEPSPKKFKQLFLDHGIPVFESIDEYHDFNGSNEK